MKAGKIIKSMYKIVVDPTFRFNILSSMGFFNRISDERYLKKKFKAYMGYNLNLDASKTFNEKLQWLKLYDRKKNHTIMADKYKVREYVAKIIGEKYLIPFLGVWDDPEDIDFELLPNQFVLKCNHNSGEGMYICKDKTLLSVNDIVNIKEALRKGLKQDYYNIGREWPYKDIQRKIICEQFMEDNETKELRDYKFFCFNGKVKCFKVDFDRFKTHRANYYNLDGQIMLCGEVICSPDYDREIKMPRNLALMIELAEKLAMSEKFLRVDFYEANNKVYFGELTFFPASGLGKFIDKSWDNTLGSWLEL